MLGSSCNRPPRQPHQRCHTIPASRFGAQPALTRCQLGRGGSDSRAEPVLGRLPRRYLCLILTACSTARWQAECIKRCMWVLQQS